MTPLARWLRWMLAITLPREHRAVVLAHLDEEYEARRAESRRAAEWWLCRHTLGSIPGALQLRWQAPRRQRARGAAAFRLVGELVQEFHHALRQLRRAPGFSVAAVVMLAIGLGLTAGVWTVVNGIYLRGWDLPDSDSVFRADAVVQGVPEGGRIADGFTVATFAHLRAAAARADYVAYLLESFDISTHRGVRGVHSQGMFVSDAFVDVLRIRLASGSTFAAPVATEERRVVISHRLQSRLFAGESNVIGRQLWLNGEAAMVTGVLAPQFTRLAERTVDFMVELDRAEQWTAIDPYASRVLASDTGCCLMIAGRRRPGWNNAGVQDELALLTAQVRRAAGQPDLVVSLRDTSFGASPQFRDQASRAIALLFVGVTLILLLTCANVGNLFLARSLRRRREIVVRVSLGAGKLRIVRQLLAEGLLLAGLAGLAALLFTSAVPVIIELAGDESAHLFPSDWRVATFTVAATVAVCLLVALTPALQASRTDLRGGGGARAGRWRQWVLTVQIAVAAVLVVSAVLIARGIQQAASSRADFALHTTSAVTMRLPKEVADDGPRRKRIRAAFDAALAQAGSRVGIAELVPVSERSALRTSIQPHGSDVEFRIDLLPLSAAAFEVLEVPVVAGRLLADDVGAGEAVVNETLARRVWPEGNAVGQRVFLDFNDREYTVVGIVRDAHLTSLSEVPPLMHIPPSASARALPLLLAPSSPGLRAEMGAIAAAVDPSVTVTVTPLAESVRDTLRSAWTFAALAGVLGLIALVLAVVGVFSVFSYLIEDRRREIGVRLALGATKRQIRLAIARACRGPVLAGVVGGLVLSMTAGRLLRGYLFGLSPLDPVSYAAVAVLLLFAAVAATAVPVRRALRVDPAITLRAD